MAEPRRIAAKDNPLLVRLRRLGGDPGAYRKLGQVWIEGDHLCDAFVRRGGRPLQAVLAASWAGDPALRTLADRAEQVALVDDALLPSISTLESPARIGFVIDWAGGGAIRADAPTVVLDRLQDAGNVGTILRSAAAFGVGQVVALKGTAALWSPKVLRAGMGSHFALHLVEGVDAEVLAALTVPLLATSSHAVDSLDRVALPWPCAWVFGHEGQGVAPSLMARCRQTLRIPQPGGEESLNAASAAAVCLYESARQRAALST
jgi:TrmH family RNA methyltransferase